MRALTLGGDQSFGLLLLAGPAPLATSAAEASLVPLVEAVVLQSGINLFSRSTGALPVGEREVATAFADVATIGILQERNLAVSQRVQGQLQQALDSRVLIEQAKGMLAEQGRVAPDVAYQRLRGWCRSHNVKLRPSAEAVLSGALGWADLAD